MPAVYHTTSNSSKQLQKSPPRLGTLKNVPSVGQSNFRQYKGGYDDSDITKRQDQGSKEVDSSLSKDNYLKSLKNRD